MEQKEGKNMTEKKYSETYSLHNGEAIHFCPTCKYHLIDTKLANTYCPRCGQAILINRPILCKNVCKGEMLGSKDKKYYCKQYDTKLHTDINGEPIMSVLCDWE